MLAPLEPPAACHQEFVKMSHLNFLKARRRDVVNWKSVLSQLKKIAGGVTLESAPRST